MLRFAPTHHSLAKHISSGQKRPNLHQRGLTWFVRYYVPKEHQAAFGKVEVNRTLGTRDKLEAHRRLPGRIAEIQREVAEVVSSRQPFDGKTQAGVLRELDAIEARHRAGAYPEQDEEAGTPGGAELELEALLDTYAAGTGAVDPEHGPRASLLPQQLAERFSQVHRAITDPGYRPLSVWAADFVQNKKDRGLRVGTWKDHENRLTAFTQLMGPKTDPRRISDANALAYLDRLNSDPDASTRLRQESVATIAAFYEWLRLERKVLRYNPFDGLSKAVQPNGAMKRKKIRAWHAEELVVLLEGLNPQSYYWPLVVLALYSGCRINEICSMQVRHTVGRCLTVERDMTKNDNSPRSVPIHPVIEPLVAKLVETSFDGFLISGLVPGGQDKQRAAYPSKQFSGIRHQLGLTDPLTTFHSTRHNFATALERAGVPHATMQRLTGHKLQSITLDRYSDGPELGAFRQAVAKITYDRQESEDHPAVIVDALVTAKLSEFKGNIGWKRKGVRAILPDYQRITPSA